MKNVIKNLKAFKHRSTPDAFRKMMSNADESFYAEIHNAALKSWGHRGIMPSPPAKKAGARYTLEQVFKFIAKNEDLTVPDIAGKMFMAKSTIRHHINRLEVEGRVFCAGRVGGRKEKKWKTTEGGQNA